MRTMQDLIGEMRNLRRAEHEETIEDRVAAPRQGRVVGYDPSTPHLVRVAILPEADFPIEDVGNYTTDWIPYSGACPGQGWGIYAPPSLGDQVSLIFQEHDKSAPLVVARINDDDHLPGVAVQSGEFFMLNKFGVQLYFKQDGSMYSAAPAGYTFVGNGKLQGNWEVTGNLLVDGNATIDGSLTAGQGAAGGANFIGKVTATGDMVAGSGGSNISVLGHQHGGVTSGGSNTGIPIASVSAIFRGMNAATPRQRLFAQRMKRAVKGRK